MAKILTVVAVVLLQVALMHQTSMVQPSKHKQESQPQRGQAAPNININDFRACEKDSQSPQTGDDYTRKGFILNAVLALITLLIAIAAVIQANAAKLSAAAVMRSERAWLLLNGEDIGKPVLIPSDSPTDSRRIPAHCRISLKNCGNTPAFAVDWEFELRIGDSQEIPPSLEIYGKNRPVESPMPFPIGPGWPGHAEATLQPQGFISSAQKCEIEGGSKFLWLCGIARYEDVFEPEGRFRRVFRKLLRRKGRIHETRICLRLETKMAIPEPQWVLGGPRQYNHAT